MNERAGSEWLIRAAVAVYRRVLATYPAKVRERFGDEMVQVFRDALGDAAASGRLGLLRFLADTAADWAVSVVAAHLGRLGSAPAATLAASVLVGIGMAAVLHSYLFAVIWSFMPGFHFRSGGEMVAELSVIVAPALAVVIGALLISVHLASQVARRRQDMARRRARRLRKAR